MNPVLGFFILAVCSISTDLVIRGVEMGRRHPAIPYTVRPYMEYLGAVPIGGIVFGLLFGLGCKFALSHKRDMAGTELVVGIIFAGSFQIISGVVAMLLGPMLTAASIPAAAVRGALYALVLALTSRAAFGLELYALGILVVTVAGALLGVPQIVKALPFGLAGYWYSLIGMLIAVCALRSFK